MTFSLGEYLVSLQNWFHCFELAHHEHLADMTKHSLTVQDKPVLLLTAEPMAGATSTAEAHVGEYCNQWS